MLLLTLKPLAIILRGKREAELVAGDICPRPRLCLTRLGVHFPPFPFPIHPPSPWAEDVLRKAQSPAQAASPQGGFTPLPGLTLPVSSAWCTRGALHGHTQRGAKSAPVKPSGSRLCQPARKLVTPAEQSMKPPKGDQPHKACREPPAPVNRG